MIAAENAGLCHHVQFSRESAAYPGNEEQWRAYLARGGLATQTSLLARHHAAEGCLSCGRLSTEIDAVREVQS